jgi:hypothetical protein
MGRGNQQFGVKYVKVYQIFVLYNYISNIVCILILTYTYCGVQKINEIISGSIHISFPVEAMGYTHMIQLGNKIQIRWAEIRTC